MSLIDHDRETLAAVFASRVALAKKSEEQAVEESKLDWARAVKWVSFKDDKEGSFLWFCDYFDLEASAVRRAIEKGRK